MHKEGWRTRGGERRRHLLADMAGLADAGNDHPAARCGQNLDGLRERLARGDVAAGGALPSEAELGLECGASRVTVRRALEQLRSEGLVTSRRGSGWFVAHDPVRQSLASAIVAFASDVGAVVVSEGIESESELCCLKGLAVGCGQGFYLARPGLGQVDAEMPELAGAAQ